MKLELKIEIRGNAASLELIDVDAREVSGSLDWEDNRDLSDKLFSKIDSLLKRKKVSLQSIDRITFFCDSPYFQNSKGGEIKMENMDSAGKCGFTAWQTGEIISKVLNFASR